MDPSTLPLVESILQEKTQSSEGILKKTIAKIGESLNVDRCVLCVRDPSKKRCRTAFVWRRNDSIPDDYFQQKWVEETSFINDDPLYQAALACQPSLYIPDVSKASPDILNQDFENSFFGHQALIHAHVVQDGQLWGVLEPAVFHSPREWTQREKMFVESLLPILAEHVRRFVLDEEMLD